MRPLVPMAAALLLTLLGSASSLAQGDEFAPQADRARYSVVRDDTGVWWFQGPTGSRFYSLGINNVTPEPYMPRPGTEYYNPVPTEFKGDGAAWARSVRTLLEDHGFNTLGAWSSTAIRTDAKFVSTPVLYVVQHEGTRCLSPLRPDFEQFVLANVKEAVANLPPREGLLGVFLDNEMPWFGKSGWDDIPSYTLLEQALEQTAGDSRRTAAIDFLKSRHNTIESFAGAIHRDITSWNDVDAALLRSCTSPEIMADREQFTTMLGDRFFEVTTRIVRRELPNVLILGTRFPGNAPESVIRACGRHCDVVSVNEYRFEPSIDEHTLSRFWLLGGKPLMHTEYSWRARANASGNKNSRGAGAVVDTQADRAAAYSGLVSDIATVPYVIASHWFEFADQSPQGRFDGEDSNYGIVDIHNKPYAELMASMKATNAKVSSLHAATTRKMPTELAQRRAVTYTPGQHPSRPPRQSLLEDWTNPPEIWGAPDAKMTWRMVSGELVLGFDAGSQYGAGINIFGPKSSALPSGPKFATDLDGYGSILLEITAPKGIQLNVVLAEAGAAPPSTSKFDTSAGDDGEAFISAPLYGAGVRTTHRLPIGSLIKQQFFGNQRGTSRIDMQAIRNIGIQASGEPRTGEIIVHRLELVR